MEKKKGGTLLYVLTLWNTENCVEKVYDKYTRTLWNGLRKEFIYGIHGELILKINCVFIDMVDKSTS